MGGGEVNHEINWVGMCGPLSKTRTHFKTKLCDFIYDLIPKSIPSFQERGMTKKQLLLKKSTNSRLECTK